MTGQTNENMCHYDIGLDFSPLPFGRYRAFGPNSAERLRDDILVDLLEKFEVIEVNFDNAETLSAAFLEEVFGGLVRKLNWDVDTFNRRIHIVSGIVPEFKAMVDQYAAKAVFAA